MKIDFDIQKRIVVEDLFLFGEFHHVREKKLHVSEFLGRHGIFADGFMEELFNLFNRKFHKRNGNNLVIDIVFIPVVFITSYGSRTDTGIFPAFQLFRIKSGECGCICGKVVSVEFLIKPVFRSRRHFLSFA